MSALDGVASGRPRPCVDCGEATDQLTFDIDTLLPEPPRCEACVEAEWDVQYELLPTTSADVDSVSRDGQARLRSNPQADE